MHQTMHTRTRLDLTSLTTLAALLLALPAAATHNTNVETVALFSHEALETPESVALDHQGNAYVALALTGEIRRIARDGTQSTYAQLPIGEPMTFCSGFFALVGPIVFDPFGNLYVSVGSCIPENRGIWVVRRGGQVEQLAQLPFESFPNGIAFHFGKVYVADSNLGVIWTVDARGGDAEVFIEDPRLLRNEGSPLPGANGLREYLGELYVANTDTAQIYAVRVRPNGTAGAMRHVASPGVPCDDIDLDIAGNLYCASPFGSVIKIARNGAVSTVIDASALLDYPTDVTFGRSIGEFRTIYVTSAAFPGYSSFSRPSLMRFNVHLPGSF